MDRLTTQRNEIRTRLLRGESITPMQALNEFGCFRLATRIFELKNEENLPIETAIERGDNGKRWARYYINRSYFTSGGQLQLF